MPDQEGELLMARSSPLLGVTGATGRLGGRVARRLAAVGAAQRHTQPALHRPGPRQDIIGKLKRQILGQLTQMARSEYTPGDSDGMGDRGRGRLSSQRDLW